MDSDKDCNNTTLKVLMFPWLAQGHVTPFLELAKKFTLFNFEIYICSTPVNLASIKRRITESQSKSIHLVELNLSPSPELPPHHHTTNGLSPHLNSTLKKALKTAKPDFETILQTLQPDLLIHDILTPWSLRSASEHNIPSCVYLTTGAVTFAYFEHVFSRPGIEFPSPDIRLTEFEMSFVYKMSESRMEEEDEDYDASYEIVLMNSSRELEGKYIDYASELKKWKISPVGPLVRDHSDEDDDDDTKAIMDWLGQKEDHSIVYISFGSEYFLCQEDIEEMAYGLMLSNTNFIWVIRSPRGEDFNVNELLPQGFLEKVGDKGKIVQKWAPQPKILKHKSIGGFVSHCGWNSLLESISYRVPMIAMPMHLEQPVNAKLVSELGVAVEVSRDGDGKFKREEIARAIKDAVVGGRGEVLRRQVEELSRNIEAVSGQEIKNVVKKLEELCGKKGV